MFVETQRIVVIGTTGSGKTTCARQLAQKLAIPHVELDALFWDADWTPASLPVFRARVIQALQSECWIVDGNYSKVRELIWQRATTIIWLDYSLWIIMLRLLKRTIGRIMSSDSILLWALKTYHKHRRVYSHLRLQPEYTHIQFVHLRSPRATHEWLFTLPSPANELN